jgi:hypothetical protein
MSLQRQMPSRGFSRGRTATRGSTSLQRQLAEPRLQPWLSLLMRADGRPLIDAEKG